MSTIIDERISHVVRFDDGDGDAWPFDDDDWHESSCEWDLSGCSARVTRRIVYQTCRRCANPQVEPEIWLLCDRHYALWLLRAVRLEPLLCDRPLKDHFVSLGRSAW